jgi:hypothetical protein
LCQELDQLELSVQQQTSLADALYEDPLCRALGEVEAATIRQEGGLTDDYWRLLGMLRDRPEPEGRETRRSADSADAEKKTAMADGSPLSGTPSSPGNLERALRPPAEPLRAREDPSGRDRVSRENSQPAYHVMGHSTGIRNLGSASDRYCRLREAWVSAEDCESCEDYESSDDEEAVGVCRHSHRGPDRGEDEGADSDKDEK